MPEASAGGLKVRAAMFHFDRGLKLTKIDLAIDVRRRQPRAFISHAHTDHMARHQLALATPATARFYQLRLGERDTLEMPFRQPLEWDSHRLTTFPAGHCLGSAMLLAEDGDQRLLYTGDCKLRPSATAEECELPQADILVMECTYGDPRYRLPVRQQALGQLFELLRQTLDRGATPVVYAYALGKAQELTRLITAEGFPVAQHPDVYRISVVYEELGVPLGQYVELQQKPPAGHVVVAPPRSFRRGGWSASEPIATFAVSGWAAVESTRRRLGVDHAIALSDHADYDELLEIVRRVEPKEIYCTHGPASFVDRLREAGFNAFQLADGKRSQSR